jgi:hypothetical protein
MDDAPRKAKGLDVDDGEGDQPRTQDPVSREYERILDGESEQNEQNGREQFDPE